MKLHVALIGAVTAILAGCGTTKNAITTQVIEMDTIEVVGNRGPQIYRASQTRHVDLIHSALNVTFDWENQYLNGKATLTMKPYFYPTQEVRLDAKGFDIHNVNLSSTHTLSELNYVYDGEVLTVNLGKTYSRTDTFNLVINYTAKPNEREAGGSAAITSDKGLYFINPDGADPNKPRQIWTQGETEASSAWFPTIDQPNERMTQELYITVDADFVTLSNGTREYSLENADGTRTDYWTQQDPHAPYLTMMAVGDFAEVKDTWRDSMAVDYYVEKKYKPHAKAIFGETPAMIEFFSSVLNYDYPWEKYAQIVVRDYVSGAMENTTAVIHGDFLHQTTRELIDGNNEDIIAHELFHHWFGDLVTCESWSNLPLNESFATYGEYLWNEHRHGRDYADSKLNEDHFAYLMEARSGKQVDLVRFKYDDKEDMFDAHSYQKGGRVLHMLRKYLGDDAFFTGLNKYLVDNAYTDVEMHELRIAMEEVSGEDLNWFFNQWFFASGHPDLLITYAYNDSLAVQTITIEQQQDLEKTPLYRLPMMVDLYIGDRVERKSIVLDSAQQTFTFNVSEAPSLVNVDAEKMLLGTKSDKKSLGQYQFQYYNAPLFLDRSEAVDRVKEYAYKDKASAQVLLDALNDPSPVLRSTALAESFKLKSHFPNEVENRILDLAKNDNESFIRAQALETLNDEFQHASILELANNALKKDSSYMVIGVALQLLAENDPAQAMLAAEILEDNPSASMVMTIANLYAEYGSEDQGHFFVTNFSVISGFERFGFMGAYSRFLTSGNANSELIKSIVLLETDISTQGGMWFIKVSSVNTLHAVNEFAKSQKRALEQDIASTESGLTAGEITAVEREINYFEEVISAAEAAIERLKKQDLNERILKQL